MSRKDNLETERQTGFLCGATLSNTVSLMEALHLFLSHQAIPLVKAIVSDIHGNLEALCAVLDDIAAHNVRDIYCLGDLINHGPNPCECIDLLMNCSVVLLGNHDRDAVSREIDTSSTSYRWTLWTRHQLATSAPNYDQSRRRREFLNGLPRTHREGEFLFVHGSPRNPVEEYVFPEDIYNQRKMEKLFALVDRYCFMGHTHLPGIFTEDLKFHRLEEFESVWQLGDRKTFCNVGAVGQPRDGDVRASYVLLDGLTVRFRRVDYDIDATMDKINDINDI